MTPVRKTRCDRRLTPEQVRRIRDWHRGQGQTWTAFVQSIGYSNSFVRAVRDGIYYRDIQ